ncbi:cupin domain-containing protein [Pseudoalteromonas sp. S16_S37]|uniref:cupin domain-containing protein n=1 Tax=Pseudoalteromonas sp. S16_S37 TaxID=2720228 RepID=UPI001680D1D1|nr:cupin domain-containing protein [Pseudoalteromonas sp. S16_S37]MBD1581259.1 cupin domain-containing protein [Pseudoalteromonas sp. S16_S37]
MPKINLEEKFSKFTEHWTPKIIAESNSQLVKIAKGDGELVWHKHDNEDELFMVFKGQLTLQLPDGDIVLNPGELTAS